MGNAGKGIEAILRKQWNALRAGIIRIRLAHIGCARAERAVQQQLMLAQPVMAMRFAIKMAIGKETLKLFGREETALLHDAHSELTCFGKAAVSVVNGRIISRFPKIIRVSANDPLF